MGQVVDLQRSFKLLDLAGLAPRSSDEMGRNSPLSYQWVSLSSPRIEVGSWCSSGSAIVTVYQFGVVSIEYEFGFADVELTKLCELSDKLYDDLSLDLDALKQAQRVLDAIRAAVKKPDLSKHGEDYWIFRLDSIEPGVEVGSDWVREHRDLLAQILNSEDKALSEQMGEAVLRDHLSYRKDEFIVFNWNAAVIRSAEAESHTELIEFVNAMVMATRVLGSRARHAVDESKRSLWARLRLPQYGLAWLLAQYSKMFATLDNPQELFGDDFRSLFYRRLMETLDIKGRRNSIRNRLEISYHVFESKWIIQQGWIIIVLILYEILAPWINRMLGVEGH